MFNYKHIKIIFYTSFSLIFSINILFAQAEKVKDDIGLSMYWQETGEYINSAETESGDLWNKLGHHGPGIENLWVGYRIYFNERSAIDIYSKFQPRLELKESKWYESKKLNDSSYGTDYYHVGKTIGVGSVRLYEADTVKMLSPVTNRYAEVSKEAGTGEIMFLSEGIPYKNDNVDLLIKLTVFSGYRHAKIETFVLSDKKVQLVTGLNFHETAPIKTADSYLFNWGTQPSNVTKERIDIGAALIYDPEDFAKTSQSQSEYLLISKPTKYLRYWITSANAKEPKLNSKETFEAYINELKKIVLQ